jgi:hypothetical protein
MKSLKKQGKTKKTNHLLNFKTMKTNAMAGIICLALSLFAGNLLIAQDNGHDHDHEEENAPLHVNSVLGSCDFDISPDLSQSEWKTFNKEAGNLIYLNPLSSSKPLGKLKWDLTLEGTTSDINDNKGAWNNTMHHPDSTHTLTDNGRVMVPGLRFRIGVTERIDVGIYYAASQPFGAKYGFLGFEAKYAFINDTINNWAASVRASYVFDANIKDFNIGVAGLDLTASKTFFNVLSPYAGVSVNWNHSKIITNEVSLANENYFGVRGIAGLELRWKFVNLGYEFMLGDGFNNQAFKIGVTF